MSFPCALVRVSLCFKVSRIIDLLWTPAMTYALKNFFQRDAVNCFVDRTAHRPATQIKIALRNSSDLVSRAYNKYTHQIVS